MRIVRNRYLIKGARPFDSIQSLFQRQKTVLEVRKQGGSEGKSQSLWASHTLNRQWGICAGDPHGRLNRGTVFDWSINMVLLLFSGPLHHFFGYYGICPWNSTNRYHLSLQTDFHDREPAPQDIAVAGLVEIYPLDRNHK